MKYKCGILMRQEVPLRQRKWDQNPLIAESLYHSNNMTHIAHMS